MTPILVNCLKSKTKSALVLLLTPLTLAGAYMCLVSGYDIWSYLKYTFVWLAFYYGGMLMRMYEGNIKLNKKILLAGLPICFIFQLVETLCLLKYNHISAAYSQMRVSGFLYAGIITLLICSYSDTKLDDNRLGKMLAYLGDNTYGIFYIHCAWLILFNKIYEYMDMSPLLPLLQIVQLVFSIGCSLITIYILKKYSKIIFPM